MLSYHVKGGCTCLFELLRYTCCRRDITQLAGSSHNCPFALVLLLIMQHGHSASIVNEGA